MIREVLEGNHSLAKLLNMNSNVRKGVVIQPATKVNIQGVSSSQSPCNPPIIMIVIILAQMKRTSNQNRCCCCWKSRFRCLCCGFGASCASCVRVRCCDFRHTSHQEQLPNRRKRHRMNHRVRNPRAMNCGEKSRGERNALQNGASCVSSPSSSSCDAKTRLG